MDAALAQPPTYQSSYIPNEIYRPLMEIAQQGYNANDVLQWYLAIKQRVDTANVSAPYSLTPPFSTCSPAPIESHGQLANSGAISPIDTTGIGQNPYDNSRTGMSPWSESLPFDTPRRTSIYVTTPPSNPHPQLGDSSIDAQGSVLQMLPPWSTETSTKISEPEGLALTTTVTHPENASTNAPTATRWYKPNQIDIFNQVSRKRTASQSSIYPEAMTNPSIPFLSSPPQGASPFVPISAAGDITYLAPISIIPSRKRRKTLRKGERKIIQPMQVVRQAM